MEFLSAPSAASGTMTVALRSPDLRERLGEAIRALVASNGFLFVD